MRGVMCRCATARVYYVSWCVGRTQHPRCRVSAPLDNTCSPSHQRYTASHLAHRPTLTMSCLGACAGIVCHYRRAVCAFRPQVARGNPSPPPLFFLRRLSGLCVAILCPSLPRSPPAALRPPLLRASTVISLLGPSGGQGLVWALVAKTLIVCEDPPPSCKPIGMHTLVHRSIPR